MSVKIKANVKSGNVEVSSNDIFGKILLVGGAVVVSAYFIDKYFQHQRYLESTRRLRQNRYLSVA